MENCIFCKIIKNEIPSSKIYEDEDTLCFLSIEPINQGHLLVIPKTHESVFYKLNDDVYQKLMIIVKKMGILINEKIKPKKVGVEILGFDVGHVHVHVIPLNESDEILSKKKFEGKQEIATKEELEIAKSILLS